MSLRSTPAECEIGDWITKESAPAHWNFEKRHFLFFPDSPLKGLPALTATPVAIADPTEWLFTAGLLVDQDDLRVWVRES
jgi:hypothetical protein